MGSRIVSRMPVVLLAGAALAALAYAFTPEALDVETGRIAVGPLTATIDEEGQAVVRDRYTISAPVAGSILRIEAEAGNRVVRGAVLARMVPAPLDARTREQLAARAEAAADALARARATEQAARAAYTLACSDHARAEQLGGAGAVSRSDVERATTGRASAQGDLRAAEAATRTAAHELQEARAALLSAAGGAGRRAAFELRSPVAGTVLRIFEESERVVPPGTPLLEIGDPAALEIVADLLSSDAVKVAPSARVMIEGWGGAGTLAGRVRLIEPASFTKVSALGVEEQRVNVFIELQDPPEVWRRLGDRFGVDVRIILAERPAALKAQAGAIFRHADGWGAFVVEGRRARLRAVTPGLRAGYDVEILSGLREGEEVILHPSEKVMDGVRVTRR